MTKVTDISQFHSRRSPMAPTLRDSGALFWKEASADATPDALRRLPQVEMAAVLIKGLFAIYHLSREHATLSKKVPGYLYDYALRFEMPIIPTAETLYARRSDTSGSVPLVPRRWRCLDYFEMSVSTVESRIACLLTAA